MLPTEVTPMAKLGWGLVVLLLLYLERQSAPGIEIENALKTWSDRAMLLFLQMTSQFESRAPA